MCYTVYHCIQHYPIGGIAFADTHLHKHSSSVQQAAAATATTATALGDIELVDISTTSSSPKHHAAAATAKLFDSRGV
jgi:hypothetical protein